MKIGVVGLGLIGGSMAKAVKYRTEHEVFGWDISQVVRASARLVEAVDDFLPEGGDPEGCDMVIIALYPEATVEYVKKYADRFKKVQL